MNITIRAVNDDDFDKIYELCNERYGKGYITRRSFDAYTSCHDLFKVALIDGEFAGFALMLESTKEQTSKHMKMPLREVQQISDNRTSYIYKSLSVVKKFEKLGLPVKMSEIIFEELKKRGESAIFASAWMIDGKIPIAKMFDTLGFVQLYEKQNLWYDDEDYTCIVCGGRCKCDAMLYYKYI